MHHRSMAFNFLRRGFPNAARALACAVIALAAAAIYSAAYANLTISARDVVGVVMPPGMIMTRDTSAEAMRDMAAVDLHHLTHEAPPAARGDQLLQPRTEDGAKVFDLETGVTGWNIGGVSGRPPQWAAYQASQRSTNSGSRTRRLS